jgi:hypothetical protein
MHTYVYTYIKNLDLFLFLTRVTIIFFVKQKDILQYKFYCNLFTKFDVIIKCFVNNFYLKNNLIRHFCFIIRLVIKTLLMVISFDKCLAMRELTSY